MATLGKLVALAALSALSIFAMTTIYTNTNIEIQYVAFSVNLVVLGITAYAFSIFTSIEQKMENLRLKLRLAKSELSPLKDLVEFITAKEKAEVERACVTEVKVDKDTANPSDTGVIFEELNPRTKKPYKMSFAKRMALREKALEREQNKRIAKTTEKSTARKVAKTKKRV